MRCRSAAPRATRQAAYHAAGSTATALLFRYTVQAGDFDTDGVELGSAIALNGGTMASGTATANLLLVSVGATSGVRVGALQTITFNSPGSQNFGTTPTLSASSSSALLVQFSSSTPGVCSITVGGALNFLTTGSCTILANQPGSGVYLPAPQESRTFAVNAVVPGAPTMGTATAGDGQATVTFTPPAFTGGAAITGYTAISTPGGLTATGSTSPITVTGLTNGQLYSFRVIATNNVGNSGISGTSNLVIPMGTQTITFNDPGTQTLGSAPAALTATTTAAAAGLQVAFTSPTPQVCTVTQQGLLTLLDTGTCTVRADQAGNYRYLPAPQVERSFAVVRKAVASAAVPGMAGTATATLSGGGALCSLQATGGFGPAVHKPPQMDAPHGQFSFTAEHCDSTPVTITLQYPEPLPANVAFRKPDGAGGWFDPQDAATPLNLQVSNGRRTVSYDITDNSLGDANSATGIIEDPLIPVVPLAMGGGAVGIPTLGEWALALLSALVGVLGWRRRALLKS